MNVVMLCILFFALIVILSLFLNNKAKFAKLVSKKLDIVCLGKMPFNPNNKNILIDNNPKANIMRYIKDIRNNIMKLTDKKIIAFFSCSKGEGKSWVANNLAISFARINKKVLLIDANLREISNKSKIFYTEEGEELLNIIESIENRERTEYLKTILKSVRQTQIPNLYILPNGKISKDSYKLLKTKNYKELLNTVKGIFDYIIIDGTAFLVNRDCLDLSMVVDTNIIVIEKNKTKYTDLLKIKEEFEDNNSNILGFILNKTSLRFGKYYGKNIKHRYGTYIETTEKSNNELISEKMDFIQDCKSNESNKQDFNKLQQEIKDKILIEDFINDIQVNFNLKLDNIEKNTRENVDYLINIILQNNKKINEEINKYNENIIENNKNQEKSVQDIMSILDSLQEQLDSIKNERNTEKINFIQNSMNEIKNKIYDEKFENINKKIESLNYIENIQEINEKLENKDYSNKIAKLEEKIESMNYEKKIDELNEKVDNISYDDIIEKINQKLDLINFEKNFTEIKELISENNSHNTLENTIENFENNEEEKNNIINLRKLFIENRKKNNNVFSIDESISYYDLERLAIEVITFDKPEDNYTSLIY